MGRGQQTQALLAVLFSTVAAFGVTGCWGDASCGGSNPAAGFRPAPGASAAVDRLENWRGVDVVRRFFRENGKVGCNASVVRFGHGIAYVPGGADDDMKLALAIAKDCEAPDAEMATSGAACPSAYVLGVILWGERYAIVIGMDAAGGCSMGRWQYRWRAPNLARVLAEILKREGLLDGEGGEHLREVLKAVGTGGAWSLQGRVEGTSRPSVAGKHAGAGWDAAEKETPEAEAKRLEAELLLDPWKPPPGWPFRDRRAVVDELVTLGDAAVPALLEGLRSPSVSIRWHAALGLGNVGPAAKAAAGSLAEVVEKDKEEIVAMMAARALSKVGPPPSHAIPALVEAIRKRGDCTVGDLRAAMVTLGRSAVPVYLGMLRSAGEGQRGRAVDALGEIGPAAGDAADALVGRLAAKDDSICTRVTEALSRIGTKAVPSLLKAAREDDNYISFHVSRALGSMGPAVVPFLRQALKGENASVRAVAAEAIGMVGPAARDAVPEVAESLQDRSEKVRAKAARSLGCIAPGMAAAGILTLLTDADEVVRCNATEALGKSPRPSKEVIAAIGRMLGDDSELVRGSAAEALGNLGPAAEGSLPALLRISKEDRDEVVREAAGKAIHLIRQEKATPE